MHNHHFIDVSQLRVGLYVHLDLGWMNHPFTLSNFKIKDETQISGIQKTGLKKLRYDPNRSDCEPLPEAQVAEPNNTQTAANNVKEAANNEVSKEERLGQLNAAINEAELKFIAAGNTVREATKNILIDPKVCIEKTANLIDVLVETTLTEGDIAIHALNGNNSGDDNYVHPLNVTVLAMMLAKSLELSAEDTRLLGMAAVFHDIGKIEISSKILLKKEPLTKQEQLHFEQHSEIGARMAREVGLPARIGKVILQHHVHEDGTGYPKRITADKIDPIARIIALVNWYDNLCNPSDVTLAKTPYEALAQMYAHHRAKFDEMLVKRLIKSLGIYPPGSIVQLSSGVYGIVVSVNPNQPLRPYVLLHDPLMQRDTPHILNLSEEQGISISACLRPNKLPLDALKYLNPHKRVNYFLDTDLSKIQDDKSE
ncbi:MAG TPA: DUF3391 domain-containing protein [Methylotenera sp.]|nr:DUF3391 domain-containing protein [Methylotenera sp.]HPH05564.1 DUF3391 domain-containing protein [Methylotenera sp.]HPN00022.1 DUF3391 domain-containing protein [Methylotenera sp.]